MPVVLTTNMNHFRKNRWY